MYVIKMGSDKSLIATIISTIYQGENNADTLMVFLPVKYEDTEIANCDIKVDYTLPDGTKHIKILKKNTENYKGFYVYSMKIDEEFTSYVGSVILSLRIENIEDDTLILSGSTSIPVLSKNTGVTVDVDKISGLEAEVISLKSNVDAISNYVEDLKQGVVLLAKNDD